VNGECRIDRQIVIGNAKCLVNNIEVGRDMTTVQSSKSAFVDGVNCCKRRIGSCVAIGSQPVRSGILVWVTRYVDLLQTNHERCTAVGSGISPWGRLNSYSRLNDCGGRSRRVSCATGTDVSCEGDSLSTTCL
jgi:hypothetical protein